MDNSIILSLISAGAVIFGAGLQQVFSLLGKHTDHRQAMQQLQRDKLEKIAELLYQSQAVTHEITHALAAKDHPKVQLLSSQSLLGKYALQVCSLALLFFPALKGEADTFLMSSIGLDIAFNSIDEEAIIIAGKKNTEARNVLVLAIENIAGQLGLQG